jgi:FkbM family methyltransferase
MPERRAGLELKSLPSDLLSDAGRAPESLPRPALLREGGYIFILERLLRARGITARGVIHVGANIGQEALPYMLLGIPRVVFVEPVPEVFAQLRRNLSAFETLDSSLRQFLNANVGTQFVAVEVAIGARDGSTCFYLTGSNLFGSTLQPLDFQVWFDYVLARATDAEARQFREWSSGAVEVIGQIEAPLMTLDTMMAKYVGPDSSGGFNILSMNIQGGEIEALKGAQATLQHIELVVTEMNYFEFYKGCAQAADMVATLGAIGFEQVTEIRAGPVGTAIFVRKALNVHTAAD